MYIISHVHVLKELIIYVKPTVKKIYVKHRNDQTHFFEFFHQRKEVSLEQLGFGLADDWLRKD